MAFWQRTFRQAAIEYSRLRVRRFASEGPPKGRAALVYLIPSALNGVFLSHHDNFAEVSALHGELKRRGYAVSAFDYRSRWSVEDYDLILGFGEAVYRAQLAGAANVTLYATGAGANFQHRTVEAVLGELTDRFGRDAVKHVRIPERYLGISEALSGSILSIGNAWTASTFARPERIRSLPGIVSSKHAPVEDILGNLAQRGSDIAWVGSKGVLHKGLHTVAEVAAKLGVHLHALGLKPDERPFAEKVLTASGCKHTLYPFVTPGGAVWNGVVAKCKAVVGASLSEGMSTALLTAARSGLYPISTDTCGISLGEVVTMGANAANDLAANVERVLALSPAQYKDLLAPAIRDVASNNTFEAYTRRLSEAFESAAGRAQ